MCLQERQVLSDHKSISYEQGQACKSMENWAKDEGEDVDDVITGIQRYRQTLKSIRDREDKLIVIRDRKRHLESKQSDRGNKLLKGKSLEAAKELSILEHECRIQEQDLADFKRFALREAFYVRFNALAEYAEKLSMVAGFGKYLVDQIPIEPTPLGQPRNPYNGVEQTNTIVEDAFAAIDGWRPSEQDQRFTMELADRMSSIDLSDAKLTTSPSTISLEESRNSYVDSPVSVDSPTSPFSTRSQRSVRIPSSSSSRVDMPPSYQPGHYSVPVPTAPFESTLRAEATEFSSPQNSQMYQVPNEIDSPTRAQFSSEQISNYNQLYRHISTKGNQAPRSYSDYVSQKRPEVGAFRLPSNNDILLSAAEEKRKRAEREYAEEMASKRSATPGYAVSSAPPYWSMPSLNSEQGYPTSDAEANMNQYQSAAQYTVRSQHSPNTYHESLPQGNSQARYPH
ncbi:lipid-binding protein [Umbelopsis sp. WA50703]